MESRFGLTPLASRRTQAADLLAAGCSIETVAARLNVTVETVRRYKRVLDHLGPHALRDMSAGGRPSALDAPAREWIAKAVSCSPRKYGFEADRWSNPKLQALIERQFGVRFSTVYVRQLTIDLGLHDRMRPRRTPVRRPPGVLNDEALSWIAAALRHSPKAQDIDADHWTNERLRCAIEKKLGARYSRRYVWQIATGLGLSHLLVRPRR